MNGGMFPDWLMSLSAFVCIFVAAHYAYRKGDYLVDGMKFQMGGWWLMDFTISAKGQTDAVHFNMMLK